MLKHNDHNNSAERPTKTYDWATADGETPPEALRWAAFYTDTGGVEHRRCWLLCCIASCLKPGASGACTLVGKALTPPLPSRWQNSNLHLDLFVTSVTGFAVNERLVLTTLTMHPVQSTRSCQSLRATE